MSLRLDPGVVPADGASTATAVATVSDGNGHAAPGLAGVSFRTDGDVRLSKATDRGDGTYAATVTASHTGDIETLTVDTPWGSASATINEVGPACSPPPGTGGAGTWTPVAAMPQAASYPAAATGRDGRIYAFGGESTVVGQGTTLFSVVQQYEPCSSFWQTLPSMPGGVRTRASAAAGPDGRIYVAGGGFNISSVAASDLVEAYTPGVGTTPGRWETLAPMHTARTAPAATVGSDGLLYVSGGARSIGDNSQAASAALASVEAYSPQTGQWTGIGPMSVARLAHGSATAPDGRVFVVGGSTAAGEASLSAVEAYNDTTKSWASVAPMSQARGSLGVASGSDGRIYATGGEADPLSGVFHPLETAEAYDGCTAAWQPVTPMPSARAAHAAVAGADGRIYVLGGITAPAGTAVSNPLLDGGTSARSQATSTVEAYTPDRSTSLCPRVSVDDVTVTRDPSHPTAATFTVTLDRPAVQPLAVDYQTHDGTALAGTDYDASGGRLEFGAGDVSKTFAVAVLAGAGPDPDKTFTVKLALENPGMAVMAKDTGTGTIVSGSPATTATSTTTTATSTSTTTTAPPLSTTTTAPSPTTTTTVAPGTTTTTTAPPPSTTTTTRAPSTTTSIAAATTTTTAPSTTTTVAPTTTTTTTPATTTTSTTVAAALAAVSVAGPGHVAEPRAGTVPATFTLSLSAPPTAAVSVGYATADGTATAGRDYTPVSGTATFAPNQLTTTVDVAVLADPNVDGSEDFSLNLSALSGPATLGTAQARAVIDDPSPLPTVAVADALPVTEPAAGTTATAAFAVSLSGPATAAVSVDYATADGSATAGRDYTATSGTLAFAPGDTTRTVTVAVLADPAPDGSEDFFVHLSGLTGPATLGAARGRGVIDDGPTPAYACAVSSTSPPTLAATTTDPAVSGVRFSLTTAAGAPAGAADFAGGPWSWQPPGLAPATSYVARVSFNPGSHLSSPCPFTTASSGGGPSGGSAPPPGAPLVASGGTPAATITQPLVQPGGQAQSQSQAQSQAQAQGQTQAQAVGSSAPQAQVGAQGQSQGQGQGQRQAQGQATAQPGVVADRERAPQVQVQHVEAQDHLATARRRDPVPAPALAWAAAMGALGLGLALARRPQRGAATVPVGVRTGLARQPSRHLDSSSAHRVTNRRPPRF